MSMRRYRSRPELIACVDDRPKLKMRKHDAQFGWFKAIAERHGSASFECQQAKRLFEESKVYFQPELLPAAQTADASEHAARAVRGNVTRMEIRTGGHSVVIDGDVAKKLRDAADRLRGPRPIDTASAAYGGAA